MDSQRIATDYGYVHRLLSVIVLSKNGLDSQCDLLSNDGCGYIFDDTFGYIDFKQVAAVCGLSLFGYPYAPYPAYNYPYQIKIAYEAGLPTGMASQPGILEALAIMAQIDLNEKQPGLVAMNEGVADVGIQEFRVLDYSEKRRDSSLKRTALGSSAKANRAAQLIDISLTKARRAIRI